LEIELLKKELNEQLEKIAKVQELNMSETKYIQVKLVQKKDIIDARLKELVKKKKSGI